MWPHSALTKKLNIRLPLIQAPMAGGITSTTLIANVSNAGALGSLGGAYLSASDLQKAIQEIRKQTQYPFAVNLFIPQTFEANNTQIEAMQKIIQNLCPELNLKIPEIKPPYIPSFEDQFETILQEKIPIFSFTFGCLSAKQIARCKQQHIILIGTATSLVEAQILEQQGIDIIVAQGCEAGGHRGTFQHNKTDERLGISPLLQQLVQQIKFPVVASGGIMNASDIVAAINQGATGVQMGSAFLCCTGSLIDNAYKQLLLTAKQDDTVLTRAFSGRIARGLRNLFIDRMAVYEKDILPFPIQNAITGPMRLQAKKQANTNFMSLWAGQRAFLCQAISEQQLIETLDQEVTALLKGL